MTLELTFENYLPQGWPIKKADISMTHKDRYVANVSKIFKWTEADAEQQVYSRNSQKSARASMDYKK